LAGSRRFEFAIGQEQTPVPMTTLNPRFAGIGGCCEKAKEEEEEGCQCRDIAAEEFLIA
jgi:hypothetical protein